MGEREEGEEGEIEEEEGKEEECEEKEGEEERTLLLKGNLQGTYNIMCFQLKH